MICSNLNFLSLTPNPRMLLTMKHIEAIKKDHTPHFPSATDGLNSQTPYVIIQNDSHSAAILYMGLQNLGIISQIKNKIIYVNGLKRNNSKQFMLERC